MFVFRLFDKKPAQEAKTLEDLREEGYQTDPFPKVVLTQLANGT